MERIVYRKTLDVHKNGIQFTLRGFETADKMSRKIEISLMASGDTIDFPLEQMTAMLYVTTPNAKEPSINECTIKNNTILCDILPIVDEGITEMQIKLVETSIKGAKSVLPTPKFAIEVSRSSADDENAEQSTTYTALENAIAKANGVYDARLLRIELDTDCTFRAVYADGTVYENDVLKELFLRGDVLLSQSYARGGTGIRKGEDTDNSMYYSNVSKSASQEAHRISGEATELLTEVAKHGVYTAFSVDFETGEVEYVSPSYTFSIDKETGELKANGKAYTFEEDIHLIVTEWLANQGVEKMRKDIAANSLIINNLNKKLNFASSDYSCSELQNYNLILVALSGEITTHELNENSESIKYSFNFSLPMFKGDYIDTSNGSVVKGKATYSGTKLTYVNETTGTKEPIVEEIRVFVDVYGDLIDDVRFGFKMLTGSTCSIGDFNILGITGIFEDGGNE